MAGKRDAVVVRDSGPGAVVYSPSSVRCAVHMVLTVGPNLMQSAFNMGQSTDAFDRVYVSRWIAFIGLLTR